MAGPTGRGGAEVAKAFEALARSIKRMAIHWHAQQRFAELLQPAHAELSGLLSRHGPLSVAVEPEALLYEGQAVLSEPARDTSLCFRLYRDGVRRLTFSPSLTFDELVGFARIAQPLEAEGAPTSREDAALELWKADLPSIGYQTVETWEVARTADDAEELQAIGLRAVAALLASGLPPVAEEAAQRALPPLCGSADRDALDPPGGAGRLRRAALLVLRVVERKAAGRDLDSLAETLLRLVDEMLRERDATGLAATIEGLSHPDALPLLEKLARPLGEVARLQRLASIAADHVDLVVFGLPLWLGLLPDEAGSAMATVAVRTPAQSAREVFAAAALARLDSCRDVIDRALREAEPGVARALLGAARGIVAIERLALADEALHNPDPGIQLEAIRLLVARDPGRAVALLDPLLRHGAAGVRLAAAEILGGAADEDAIKVLLQRLRSPAIELAGQGERQVLFEAVGQQRSTIGFGFLSERLTSPLRPGVAPDRAVEDQLLAVRALALDGSDRCLRVLEFIASSGQRHAAAVVQAARAAAQRLREGAGRGTAGGR
jgi:hypothetical protein